jgi:hypothetical protein
MNVGEIGGASTPARVNRAPNPTNSYNGKNISDLFHQLAQGSIHGVTIPGKK